MAPSGSPCTRARIRLDQECCYPQEKGADADKRWFARSKIGKILDFDTICNILECPCADCQSRLQLQGDDDFMFENQTGDQRKVQECANDILGLKNGKGFLMMFALLIHIGFPTLIIPSLRANRDDGILESWCLDTSTGEGYHDEYIARLCSAWSPHLSPNDRQIDDHHYAAGRFVQEMYKFTAPMFNWRSLRKFPRQTKMPFINEKPIDAHGISATVFEIVVHPDYLNVELSDGSSDTRNGNNVFVRKQLNPDLPMTAFLLEDKNIDKVNALNDPHIVPLLNSYQKGSECNIVFPKASGDLEAFLTLPEKNFRSLNKIPFDSQPLWNQMLGLAKALDRVINFDTKVTGTVPSLNDLRKKILGYHFDIKPANILVFDSEKDPRKLVLKITDFGQARFRQTATTTSRMHNPGGTLTYAPPEANLDGSLTLNTKYDIWSLGCVFTELMVFLRLGPENLDKFRKARLRRDEHGEDSCFFDTFEDSGGSGSKLRPAVDEWISASFKPQLGESEEARDFFNRLEKILRGMLQPYVNDRMDSRQVYSELETLIATNVVSQPAQSLIPLPSDMQERIIGNGVLSDLESIFVRLSLHSDTTFSPCKVYDVGSERTLSLYTIARSSQQNQILHLERKNGVLFPWYAYRSDRSHATQSEWDIRITSIDEEAKHAKIDYKSYNILDLRKMQGYLTGHVIIASYNLADVKISEKRKKRDFYDATKRRIIDHLTDSLASKNPSYDTTKAPESNHPEVRVSQQAIRASKCTVQLWKEAVDRKPIRAFTSCPVTTYRLVIFKDRCMWIIPFTYENRSDCSHYLKTTGEAKPPSVEVRLYPTDRSREYHMKGFRLTPAVESENQFAGIPMDLEVLHEQESQSAVTFKEIVMSFQDTNDAQKFRHHYKDIDLEWRHSNASK